VATTTEEAPIEKQLVATRSLQGALPLLIILLASGIYFLYFYATHPQRPGAVFPRGRDGPTRVGISLRRKHCVVACVRLDSIHTPLDTH
jgi:hypothetical protein